MITKKQFYKARDKAAKPYGGSWERDNEMPTFKAGADWAWPIIERLQEALEISMNEHKGLQESGDAGFWDLKDDVGYQACFKALAEVKEMIGLIDD